MIPTPVRYLLRIDDLCPTISAERWLQFRELIEEFNLQPILAIVPENHDPDLEISPPDPTFLQDHMRALESAGAMTGLHGYRHLCSNSGRSLLGLHRVPRSLQASLRQRNAPGFGSGLQILRGHGLTPRI